MKDVLSICVKKIGFILCIIWYLFIQSFKKHIKLFLTWKHFFFKHKMYFYNCVFCCLIILFEELILQNWKYESYLVVSLLYLLQLLKEIETKLQFNNLNHKKRVKISQKYLWTHQIKLQTMRINWIIIGAILNHNVP